MSFFKTIVRLGALLALSIGSLSAFAAAPGTDIDNTASVTYVSGGSPGTATGSSPTIEVDRSIDLDVTWIDGANVVVIPGETDGYLTYTITNDSNTNIAVSLALEDGTGNTSLAMTNAEVWAETVNAGFDSGDDTQYSLGSGDVLSIDQGSSITVYMVADAPGTGTDASLDDFILVATAAYYDDTGTADNTDTAIGASDAATNGVGVIETVFADPAGDGASDTDEDGEYSATGTFVMNLVASVAKTFTIDDGLDNGSDGFAIPGATLTYAITVTNGAASVMTAINLTDSIDTTNLTDPVNISITANNCTASGLSAGGATGCAGVTTSFSSPTLTVNGLEAAASGGTAVVTFDVTIK